MFNKHYGNDLVKGGTYLCLNTGQFLNVPEQGGRLPAPPNARYMRVNPLLALLVGPVVGMLFVIFLPLAVPLFGLWMLARRIGVRAPAAAHEAAALVGQRPTMVYRSDDR